MAGVPCEGTPNFWVNADGSYREEGQKKDRGRIWDKVIIVEMHVIFSFLFCFYCNNDSLIIMDLSFAERSKACVYNFVSASAVEICDSFCRG